MVVPFSMLTPRNPHADLQKLKIVPTVLARPGLSASSVTSRKRVSKKPCTLVRELDMDNKVIQAGRLDDKSAQEEYEEFLIGVTEAFSQISDS
ncbi:hypothetical protein BDR04DRAFT_1155275 [Suillus decipiens]|nr:hypothetical protein BDR04DRAFT_1155275 [Suillus decipiens]